MHLEREAVASQDALDVIIPPLYLSGVSYAAQGNRETGVLGSKRTC